MNNTGTIEYCNANGNIEIREVNGDSYIGRY